MSDPEVDEANDGQPETAEADEAVLVAPTDNGIKPEDGDQPEQAAEVAP